MAGEKLSPVLIKIFLVGIERDWNKIWTWNDRSRYWHVVGMIVGNMGMVAIDLLSLEVWALSTMETGTEY